MRSETILFIAVVSFLTLAMIVLLTKYIGLRRELGSFRRQITEIRTTERKQPLKVASFDAPSVLLAKEINLLVTELRDAAQKSAENEKRIRTIMAGVSHDFRTPLTSADGYLQLTEEKLDRLLQKGAPKDASSVQIDMDGDYSGSREIETDCELENIRDYLRIVSERIQYLKDLSNEFFEVTYLEARENLPLETVRFDTILSDVMLSRYQRIEELGLRVDTDIPEKQLSVRADRHYLERILENLFSNAEKYAKSRLEVVVLTDSTAGCFESGHSAAGEKTDAVQDSAVTFILRNDTPPELSPNPEHVFEPFYRAKDRSGQGTGLGLYVCRELANVMNFAITAASENGMFEIRLTMPKA